MNIKDITLGKLAVAGLLFNSLTPYNKSLVNFKSATGDRIDLTIQEHRNALMKWLNDWGCRHLSENQHHVASQSILDWYQANYAALFNDKTPLWQLKDQEIETVANAYGYLKDRIGTRRFRYGHESEIHWDEAMRKSFGYDGSPQSYAGYLNTIRDMTLHIDALCRSKGFQIGDFPEKIGRPNSMVLELINEYVWVTETRKINLPSSKTLLRWASLG